MRVNVLYFASIRESLGIGSEQIETDSLTIDQLRNELINRGGAYAEVLAMSRVLKAALNQEMWLPTALRLEGCEVAFFPPVTGG